MCKTHVKYLKLVFSGNFHNSFLKFFKKYVKNITKLLVNEKVLCYNNCES